MAERRSARRVRPLTPDRPKAARPGGAVAARRPRSSVTVAEALRARRRISTRAGQAIAAAITLTGMAAGLLAMAFAAAGRFDHAVAAIVFAMVCDGLDGQVARALQSPSRFGAQLDSLADFASFGLAPAAVMAFWSADIAGAPAGVALAALGFGLAGYVMAAGWRLARFMVEGEGARVRASGRFQGVPTPAAALLALTPIAGLEMTGWAGFAEPWGVAGWVAIIARAMVSRWPTPSVAMLLAGFAEPRHRAWCVACGLVVGAIGLWAGGYAVLLAAALAYLAALGISIAQRYSTG